MFSFSSWDFRSGTAGVHLLVLAGRGIISHTSDFGKPYTLREGRCTTYPEERQVHCLFLPEVAGGYEGVSCKGDGHAKGTLSGSGAGVGPVREIRTTRQGPSSAAIENLIAQRVAGAMAAYEANQNNQNRNRNPNNSALTWWDSHKRTIRTDAAYAMTWKTLMKLMTEKLKGYAENKRRFDNNPKDNRVEQPPFKRQNVTRAYTAGNNNKKGYAGILPLCNKCKLHHHRACPVKCGNCKKVGYQSRD
ncbi:hypothetical protein Tco_0919983 [Tanacetum coccineum]